MPKLTRGKVAYDLEQSPYKVNIFYKQIECYLEYSFSSEFYRSNFLNRLESHRSKIKESLTKRFGLEISIDILSDIKLYQSIEKRGFLIDYKGDKITCLNNVRLDGNNLMMKH